MKAVIDLIEKMTDVRIEAHANFKVVNIESDKIEVLTISNGKYRMVTILHDIHAPKSKKLNFLLCGSVRHLTSASVDIVLADNSVLTVDFGAIKLQKAIANVDHTAAPSVLVQQILEVFYLTDLFPGSAPNRVSLDRMFNDLFGQELSEDFWQDPEVLETLQYKLIGHWVNNLSPDTMYLTNTIQAVLDLPKPNRHSFVSMLDICTPPDDTTCIITFVNGVKTQLKIKQPKLDIYTDFNTRWFTDQLPEEGIDILSDLGYMYHIESTKSEGN